MRSQERLTMRLKGLSRRQCTRAHGAGGSKRIGRPSEFTEKIGDVICKRVADGKSLSAICRPPGMPAISTVLRWVVKYPEFANEYERAREARAEVIFEETLAIADDRSRDYVQREDGRR